MTFISCLGYSSANADNQLLQLFSINQYTQNNYTCLKAELYAPGAGVTIVYSVFNILNKFSVHAAQVTIVVKLDSF